MLDEWADIYLDDEGNFKASADGDVQLVTGKAAYLQDVKHELETVLGSYPFDETYGTRLIMYLQRENTELSRQELIQDVEEIVQRHSFVVPGSVDVRANSWTLREIEFSVSFSVQTPDGIESAELTVQITVDGVRVVRSE
ncbi:MULTISPECIES: hypothetical protein [Paenibacillaceae]|uniref:Uncharacterized protein n=1 Tax=Aneurinibacillus danicus TaxID=267746 RepID=A0A511V854_9BACL|nr:MULTISPECIES: hypothetical protein [Paenibacillaceae]PZM65719.1 hypothetical protein DOE73_10445 [Paenibacillus dendritiformis]GEN33863.1 hypothetical protein ADA01nite_13230 [Aneurinibacillus danicus]